MGGALPLTRINKMLLLLVAAAALWAVGARGDALAARLQSDSGLNVTLRAFISWSSMTHTPGVYLFRPTTLPELQAAIRATRDVGMRMRTVGSGHSWAPLFPEDGHVMLDLSLFNDGNQRGTKTGPTEARPYHKFTVQGGLTLAEAAALLLAEGVAVSSAPSSTDPTIGGALATASHGMSWMDGTLSDLMISQQIVTGDADVREFDESRDPEIFAALRAHYGLCGVTTRATLKAEPLPIMTSHTDVRVPVREVLLDVDNLRALLTDHHSLKVTIDLLSSATESDMEFFNHTGRINATWRAENDDATLILLKKATDTRISVLRNIEEQTEFPEVLMLANGRTVRANFRYDYMPRVVSPEGSTHQKPRTLQTEFAIPDDPSSFSLTGRVVTILLAQIEIYAYHNGLPLVSVSLTWGRRSSGCFLCPNTIADKEINGQRDFPLVVYLNFEAGVREKAVFEEVVHRFYVALRNGGVPFLPHLAKHITFLHDVTGHVGRTLGPYIKRFLAIRRSAKLDELGVFDNPFLTQLILANKEVALLANVTSNSAAGAAPAVHHGGAYQRLFTVLISAGGLLLVRFSYYQVSFFLIV